MKYLILSLMLCVACHARLNDSFKQCEMRYGKSKMVIKDMYEYHKSGWYIIAVFRDGKCHKIVYHKNRNKDRTPGHISDIEFNILLKNNGENWQQFIFFGGIGEGQDMYQSKNGSIASRNYNWHDDSGKPGSHFVTFKNKNHTERQRVYKANQKANLKAMREGYFKRQMSDF